jgi:eukaryotic-like serine/threonine-protein kinase
MNRYAVVIAPRILGSSSLRLSSLRLSVLGFGILGLSVFALAGCSSATTTSTPPAKPPSSATVSQPSLGQGSTSPTASAPASTPPPSSAAAAGDVGVCVTPVVTCRGELKTEPAQIIVSGDGSAFITGLTWTGWGLSSATGAGTLKLDNCNPNCAQGSYTDYQATVILSKLTGYGGGAAYATMAVDAPGSPFGSRTYHHLAP